MMQQRRKLYLVLMTLAGTALLVDRLFLAEGVTEPRSAVAASASSPGLSATATTEAIDEELSIPELPFPHDVSKFEFQGAFHDLFAPPFASSDTPSSDKRWYRARPGLMGRLTFVQTHRLDAILDYRSVKIVVLDGDWMSIGRVVDGCELTTVAGNTVLFECHDGDAEMVFGPDDIR